MNKDRAKPFSKKHRKYWIPVTGGMIFIGVLNVALGFCSYDPTVQKHERVKLVIPPSAYKTPPPVIPVRAPGVGLPTTTPDAALPDAPSPTP